MRRPVLIALIAAIVCAVSVVAAADAHLWRGTAGSTFQEWTFSTSNRPATPESFSNPFGVPSAAIDNVSYVRWYNTVPGVYGSAQGWWDIAATSVVLSIINHPNIGVNALKDIQVQVTYWDDLNKAPSVLVTPSATLVSTTTTLVESGPTGGDWYMDLWTFHVDPNQNSETITIKSHPTSGSQIDRIVVDTRYFAIATSVAQAKSFPDETPCELSGPVVSRSFDSFFYLEDRNRAAGIRVNCASGQTPAAEATAPKVSGVIRVIDGERTMDEASVEPGGSGTVLPFGMCNKAVLSGLSPQGLLIRLWGRANVPSGASSFTLDDGSGQSVRVELHGTAAPTDGAYVGITGVLGANSSGPVLRAGGGDVAIGMD